jgi:hypothetical protein
MRFFLLFGLPLFLFIVSISACQNDVPEPVVAVPDSMPVAPPPRRFMRTQTSRLRVRQTPDLEGAVIQILQEGSLVEYLYDSTKFTTPIVYNKRQYNNNWYKIETSDEQEGWVYSAFVQFLDERTNRKIITKKETAALLEAATEQQNQQQPKAAKEEAKQVINERVVNSYQNYLQQLDKGDANSVSMALARYKTLFVDKANTRTHDAAYALFRTLYDQVLANLQRQSLNSYQPLKTEIERYERAYMQRDPFTQKLANNGFNFGLRKGQVVIVEDVDFLYRIFYREMSTPMRAFMNQYQLEVPNFWWQEERLMIEPTQLARWVLSWNYFVATYPDFVWYEEAQRRLSEQLRILLQGSPQAPAFDAQTAVLGDAYQAAYLFITNNYPNSNIGRAFQTYVDVLENNDWAYSSTVDRSQQQLLKSLLE